MDEESKIKGSLEAWRAAFPAALAVNVSGQDNIVDADFVHIRGDARARLHTVNIRNCRRAVEGSRTRPLCTCVGSTRLIWTAAARLRTRLSCTLRRIQLLDICSCNQATITDAAFVHLRGIKELYMGDCNQVTITDAAFVHLRGIQTLYMGKCRQITDAAFVHLRGIQTLSMHGSNQETIKDEAFVHLRGIQELDMADCDQATITAATIAHLVGISTLNTDGCSLAVRNAADKLLGSDDKSEDEDEEDKGDEDSGEDIDDD